MCYGHFCIHGKLAMVAILSWLDFKSSLIVDEHRMDTCRAFTKILLVVHDILVTKTPTFWDINSIQ